MLLFEMLHLLEIVSKNCGKRVKFEKRKFNPEHCVDMSLKYERSSIVQVGFPITV